MYVADRTQMTTGMKRIYDMLDLGSFVEIGEGITARLTDFYGPDTIEESDGVITGYGTVGGNLVYVFSQDGDVMGGTFGEMHGKKIRNLYKLAMKSQAPVIGLLDSKGFRVEEGVDGLDQFGKLYGTMARAGREILQVMAVYGPCGGGMSIAAGMADFLFVEESGSLFINSPGVMDTAMGDVAGQEIYTDGKLTAKEISQRIRQLIELLPAGSSFLPEQRNCGDNLNRTCPEVEKALGDGAAILKAVSDQNFFLEVRPNYGKEMTTGFIKLNGLVVGGMANSRVEKAHGRLTADGLDKAAHFIELCDKLNIPVITMTDTDGFDTDATQERLLPKAAHRFLMALTSAEVPKINMIMGNISGTAYSLLNSKGLGADYVFMWKDAKVRLIDSRQAAEIINPKADPKTMEEQANAYEESHCSSIALARHGYVDKVIHPEDSRKYLIGALDTFANVY
ncbi:MAG: carboxyl transferase [Firmicutes bacterium]|nr:carboxyl transferase [Bacillota bacterium]